METVFGNGIEGPIFQEKIGFVEFSLGLMGLLPTHLFDSFTRTPIDMSRKTHAFKATIKHLIPSSEEWKS